MVRWHTTLCQERERERRREGGRREEGVRGKREAMQQRERERICRQLIAISALSRYLLAALYLALLPPLFARAL
ncbi:hypothetical protein DPMN_191860 [Dreissena polymorpha]|uniref:Uncharacterized protein n=1 Tax=Dreissena polymorpha TaxID=45954 RepID=A0A9D3Y1H4_DREPO|nr:hypothetical protein DPMN_191860 [Dreissena polymorpha]